MKILGYVGFLLIILIVRVVTRKRGWQINEYEEDGKPYFVIATDTLLFPFYYHEDGMLFKWCGEIDFDLAYDKDNSNRFASKEDALARINAWKKKQSEGIVRSYKIVEDEL